jgi:spore germination protein YaaH
MSEIEMRQKVNSNRKINKSIIFLLVLFVITSVAFWIVYPFPSDEKATYFSSENPIIFQQTVTDYEVILSNDQLYLPYEFVKEKIDSSLHFDESSSSVIVTTNNSVYQMPTEHLTYYVNQQEHTLSFPVMTKKDDSIYIATSWIEKIYPIEIIRTSETGAVQIRLSGDTYLTGKTSNDFDEDLFRIRIEPTLTSPYVEELQPNETVVIEEEKEKFYVIRKENGISGYVKKEVIQLGDIQTVDVPFPESSKLYQPPLLDWPIHVTWDAIYQSASTPSDVPKYEGVQVISPTWFHLDDAQGTIRSYAKEEYVQSAKAQGYQVWALFSNDFVAERTHEALQTFETRQKMISQLLKYASIYELDGYNIDFENVMLEDGPLLTQFMREFTPLAHEAGLVVSMDITFISSNERYSAFLEREELAKVVDYLMVMAYDEHWASSPKAGSVSSLPWVEENLERLLEVVPHDRLLLGVPLYTRLWTETTEEDGTVAVSSESMSMDEVTEWIEAHNVTPIYDEASGQSYVEWKEPEKPVTYKIWIENAESLQKRVEIVHKYRLAGMASWSDYFASEAIWKDMNESLRTKSVVATPEENES